MAQVIGKYAAKKMLGKQMEKYKNKDSTGHYDPYFTYVQKPNGKMKKVKKQVPDYIPEHDAVILAKARSRAYALDCCLFNLFGIRFGWSSVIGLIPAAGDLVDMLMAALLVSRMHKVDGGLPPATQVYMLFNILLDFLVGLVPFVGDLVDAAYKANTRNLRLLEVHLDKKYKPKASGPEKYPASPATVYEDFEDEQRLPQYHGDGTTEPRRPDPIRQSDERRGGERRDSRRDRRPSGSRRDQRPEMTEPRGAPPAYTSRQNTRTG